MNSNGYFFDGINTFDLISSKRILENAEEKYLLVVEESHCSIPTLSQSPIEEWLLFHEVVNGRQMFGVYPNENQRRFLLPLARNVLFLNEDKAITDNQMSFLTASMSR